MHLNPDSGTPESGRFSADWEQPQAFSLSLPGSAWYVTSISPSPGTSTSPIARYPTWKRTSNQGRQQHATRFGESTALPGSRAVRSLALSRHIRHRPFLTLQAEPCHCDHAIIEQVIADAAASALAHRPPGLFATNAAWAVLWAIAHNLTVPPVA